LALPLFAAIGGMVIPAVTYLLIAGGTEPRGWGVPMATDIALAVGVLSVLGTRVSPSIRAFLLGLAVVDDIGAIVVIAVFYSSGVSATWLLLALGSVIFTIILKRLDVQWVTAYLVTGLFLWFALYQGGVHPTIAGVVMGLLTPITPKRNSNYEDEDDIARNPSVDAHSTVSVVEWFEHILHPYTSFLIVPLFALANAGIEISGESLQNASTSVIAWGVFAGLFIGKPIGIVLAVFIARKSGLAATPEGADSRVFLGVGSAAGIGFTVALFISDLAFTNPIHQADAKLAILVASVASAVLSLVILSFQRGSVLTSSSRPSLR
jgi:NhaA family Na+:H+ antiporter